MIGIVIWLIFFRGGSVAPSDPNEMVYVTSVADITGTGSLGMTAKYSGVVEPEKTLSVQKDDTKKIAELHVAVGQEVKTGDPLFSYDTEDISLQLQEAELQLESLGNRITTLNQQIESLEKEKSNAPSDDQLSYTLQIQSTQLEIRTAEYDRSTKAKEIEQLKESLENADVLAEMDASSRRSAIRAARRITAAKAQTPISRSFRPASTASRPPQRSSTSSRSTRACRSR